MDKQLIERLAREAGALRITSTGELSDHGGAVSFSGDDLARFAALIAEECAVILGQQAAACEFAAAGTDRQQGAILDLIRVQLERAAAAIRSKFAR